MGFGDKLKGFKDQAQQAVAENKDKIQDAVQVVGQAANTKTHGKYATKIAKVGEKVESKVEKFAQSEDDEDTTATDAAAAPITHEPANPVTPSAAGEAASGVPEFEPHAETPAPAEAPAETPSHSAPDFE
jgi:gas vesicle protein